MNVFQARSLWPSNRWKERCNCCRYEYWVVVAGIAGGDFNSFPKMYLQLAKRMLCMRFCVLTEEPIWERLLWGCGFVLTDSLMIDRAPGSWKSLSWLSSWPRVGHLGASFGHSLDWRALTLCSGEEEGLEFQPGILEKAHPVWNASPANSWSFSAFHLSSLPLVLRSALLVSKLLPLTRLLSTGKCSHHFWTSDSLR